VREEDGAPGVRHLDTLPGHTKTINCVRFSPGGDLLASAVRTRTLTDALACVHAHARGRRLRCSAERCITRAAAPNPHARAHAHTRETHAQGDAGEVTVWRPAPSGVAPAAPSLGAPEGALGSWKALCTLRGHHDDVQDVAWSPDGACLATGSIDNATIVWDVARRAQLARLAGHAHYVQGVAWDPAGEFLVSQAGDRSVRVYGPPPPRAAGGKSGGGGGRGAGSAAARAAAELTLQHVIARAPAVAAAAVPPPAAAAAAATAAPADAKAPPRAPLFHDENMPSFFRRLAFSPDGSFLAAPAGMQPGRDARAPTRNVTWLFKRRAWGAPAAALPCPPAAGGRAVAVRFCPVLFAHAAGADAADEDADVTAAGADGGSKGLAAHAPPAALMDDAAAEAPAAAADTAAEPAAAGAATAVAPSSSSPAAAARPQAAPPAPPPAPSFALPYRVVFAVATLDHVLLYDTSQAAPLALLGALHFAAITDLAWSPDGAFLAVASADGYCSLIAFDAGDLGVPLSAAQLPAEVAARLPAAAVAAAAARTVAAAAAAAAAAVAAAAAAAAAPAVTGAAAAAADAPAAAAGAEGAGGGPRRIAPQAVGAAPADAPPAGPRRIAPQAVVAPPPPAAPAPAAEAAAAAAVTVTPAAPTPATAAETAAAASPAKRPLDAPADAPGDVGEPPAKAARAEDGGA
jgi:chromatin assembly factor 1 subunit B